MDGDPWLGSLGRAEPWRKGEKGVTHLGMEQPKKARSGSNTSLGTPMDPLGFGMSPLTQLCGVAGGGRDPKLHLGTGTDTPELCQTHSLAKDSKPGMLQEFRTWEVLQGS